MFPALTFKKNPLLNISCTYNSFNVYPKFYWARQTWSCLESSSTRLPESFVAKYVQHDRTMFSELIRTVKSVPGFKRMGHAGDNTHHLFHQESAEDKDFDSRNDHYHFVFQTFLDQAKIAEILDIFIKYHYVCEEEKQEFLTTLQERYAKQFDQLKNILNGDKSTLVQHIIKFIKACEDNDVLVNIRTFLMTQEFDYLRISQHDNHSHWETLDANNQPVETSETWYQIEEAIGAQIINNDVVHCKQQGRVYQQLLEERTALYTNNHPFIFFNRHKMQPQPEAKWNFMPGRSLQ